MTYALVYTTLKLHEGKMWGRETDQHLLCNYQQFVVIHNNQVYGCDGYNMSLLCIGTEVCGMSDYSILCGYSLYLPYIYIYTVWVMFAKTHSLGHSWSQLRKASSFQIPALPENLCPATASIIMRGRPADLMHIYVYALIYIYTYIYIYSLCQQHDFKASRWRATRSVIPAVGQCFCKHNRWEKMLQLVGR